MLVNNDVNLLVGFVVMSLSIPIQQLVHNYPKYNIHTTRFFFCFFFFSQYIYCISGSNRVTTHFSFSPYCFCYCYYCSYFFSSAHTVLAAGQ